MKGTIPEQHPPCLFVEKEKERICPVEFKNKTSIRGADETDICEGKSTLQTRVNTLKGKCVTLRSENRLLFDYKSTYREMFVRSVRILCVCMYLNEHVLQFSFLSVVCVVCVQ